MIQIILTFIRVLQYAVNILFAHRILLFVIGLFTTRRFPTAKKQHRYAILIAARNEEAVIGQLMESILAQDYPRELVSIFVIADQCTDRTAEIARNYGAVCYEHIHAEHRTKGYALEYLVDCINRDFGIETYEGYLVFDADNLLKRDYLSRMNEAFDAGEKIITSYRNTKNLCDNCISASYAIHWMRTIRTEHRARSVLRLATRIQGTGFLMAAELLKNGWHYTSLTEDRAFSADAVVGGYRISYQDAAVFYDEQPVSLRIAMRQRIRWAKGHLQALRESGGKLFLGIFRYIGRSRGIRCWDMFSIIFPRGLFTVFFRWSAFLLSLLSLLTAPNGATAIPSLIGNLLFALMSSMGGSVLIAAYTLFMEQRHLPRMPLYKFIWYCLTFPMFDVMGRISMIIALFTKVDWKPIPHNRSIRMDDT